MSTRAALFGTQAQQHHAAGVYNSAVRLAQRRERQRVALLSCRTSRTHRTVILVDKKSQKPVVAQWVTHRRRQDMVPVYRGLDNRVYRDIRCRLRREAERAAK